MIVCSCNFLSESQVRSAIGRMPRLRISQIYRSLGCTGECGRCGHTIKIILEEIRRFVTTEGFSH
jgi:bacterioferritin-associated ferredoxin